MKSTLNPNLNLNLKSEPQTEPKKMKNIENPISNKTAPITRHFDCDRTCPFYERRDLCRFNPVFKALGTDYEINSHVIDVGIEIKDLDALAQAAIDCGCTLNLGQTKYKWFGRHMGDYKLPKGFTADELGHCLHAISVNGAGSDCYEVGVARSKTNDDAYTLLLDFWSGGHGLMDAIGKDAKKLIDRYSINVARNAAIDQGWMVLDNGDELIITHPDGGTLTYADGKIEASGFVGAGCHDASSVIINALGTEDEFSPKPEYYDTPNFDLNSGM